MKFKLIFIVSIIFSFTSVNAQCPTNLSFDAGNLSFWSYYPGTYPSSNGTFYPTSGYTVFNGPPAKATTSVSQSGRDSRTGIEVIKAKADGTNIPDEVQSTISKVPTINAYKYDYSIKLGNSFTGAYADKATYYIDVPVGVTTYNITYAYALLLQDPGHTATEQPKFRASVIDVSTGTKITCASKEYYAGDGQTYGISTSGTKYINWQEVSFDLSQYAGKKIELRFEMFDCSQSGHYGYGYIALRNDGCGTGNISGNNLICSSSSSLTYSTASVDGASYTWTKPVGWTGSSTSNTITVNPNGNSGGNITVTPTQSCGNITTRSMAITTVNSVPATPEAIQGNYNVCSGSNNLVYFVPPVTGASSYTWTYPTGWTIVSGLNTNTITFNANATSGNISVKSSNLCGNSSTSSSAVSITNDALSLAGSITGVPGSIQCPNYFTASTVNLTLGASTGDIQKWQSSIDGGISWTNIANTSSTLAITPTSSTLYKAVVKNGVICVEDESNLVLVDVYSPIQMINHPASINTCASQGKTFSVTASGDGTLSYNWQVSADNGVSWTNISAASTNYTGFTTSTLSVAAGNVTTANNGLQYKCIVSSSVNCTPVTSNIATLNVSSSGTPVINTQPIDQIFCSGAVAGISVIVTGPSLTYQWQKATSLGGSYSNEVGVGATSSILSISTSGVSTNFYKCVITESCGSLTINSNIAKIDVTSSSVVSSTISSTINVICSGTNKTFTATPLNGGTSPIYAWYKNGTIISGQVANTFITNGLSNGDAIYATITSDKACAIGSPSSSNTISTIVNTLPTVNVIAGLSSLNVGASIILTNATPSGVWSSTLPIYATVSAGTITGVSEGSTTISYTITDNQTPACTNTVTKIITINAQIPSGLSYTTPNIYTKGLLITALTPTVSGGTVTGYTITPSLPTGLLIDAISGIISGTATVISAASNYTITASNTGGSVTAVVNIKVIDVIPSGLSYTTPNVYTKGTAITALNPTVSGGTVTGYTITPSLPTGLLIDAISGVISGTATVISAASNYTVTASNTEGSVTAVVNIKVIDIIPSGLSYTTPNVYTKGTAITALNPTVSGGAVTNYSITPSLPSGLVIDAVIGVISGTATVISAASNYTVTASNTEGSVTAVVNIKVIDIIPSGLSYTTPNVYTKGTAITALNPTVSGGAVKGYSITPSLPSGLQINATTGVINGTATVISPSSNYTVTASNSGGSVTAVVNITVESPTPQASLNAINYYLFEKDTVKLKLTMSNGTAPFTIILNSSLNNKKDTISNLTPSSSNEILLIIDKIDLSNIFSIYKLIDANNNIRVSDFTKDTTIVNILKPKILLTLKADPAVKQADNSFKTRLLLKIKNAGDIDLRNVQVNANLSDVFPAGIKYILDSIKVLNGNLVLNPSYTGAGSAKSVSSSKYNTTYPNNGSIQSQATLDQNYLFNKGVSLNKNEEGEIAYFVSIDPTPQVVILKLQFETAGDGILQKNDGSISSQATTSKSDDGINIEQHPELTKQGVPLPTYLPLSPNLKIGSSLSVSSVTAVTGGYQYHFVAKIKNYGNVNLDSIRIQYDFNKIYPSSDKATLVSNPIITRGNIVYNTNVYDGYNDVNLFKYGGNLQVGDSAIYEYDLKVTTNRTAYTWLNYFVVHARSINSGEFINDTSMSGTNPDPNNDNDPVEQQFTRATINFIPPAPPIVENKVYIFGSIYPATIGNLVKSTPSGTIPVWCNEKTAACLITPPATPTQIGRYIFALRSYDTTTLLYSEVFVYDTVVIKPPVPVVDNKKYIIGNTTNPLNISNQVIGLSGSIINYFRSGILQSTIPRLGTLPGLTKYTTSQTINAIESDTIGYNVTMLDPKTLLHLHKLAEEPKLLSNSTFNISYTFIVSNKSDELMSNVIVADNLQNTFPSPTLFDVLSISSTGGLVFNSGFNGKTDIQLIKSSSTLVAGAIDTIKMTVNLQPKGYNGTLNNLAIVTSTTTYGSLTINSSTSSFANETVKLTTPSVIPELSIDIPEAFSPNRDGVNDRFVILKPYGTTLELEIFNRWGIVVYYNANYNNDWDGRGTNNFIGQNLLDGGYYYTLKAKSANGKSQIFKGFVLIQR